MSLKVPCLNCPDRTETCLSTCKLYNDFKKENDKLREERNKIKNIINDLYIVKEQKFKRLNKRR